MEQIRGGKNISGPGEKRSGMEEGERIEGQGKGESLKQQIEGDYVHCYVQLGCFIKERQHSFPSSRHQINPKGNTFKKSIFTYSAFQLFCLPDNQSRIIIKQKIMSNRSDSSKGKLLMALMSKIVQKPRENPELISSDNYTRQMSQKESEEERNSEISHGLSTGQHFEESFSDDGRTNTNQSTVPDKNLENLTSIYMQLYGQQVYQKVQRKMRRENISKRNFQLKIQQYMLDNIIEEIARLQEIQNDAIAAQKLLEKSVKGGTNEEKWKIVVMSYREKLQKCEQKLEEEKRMRKKIEKELNARNQEIERLSNMNSLKFQKMSVYMQELEEKVAENEEMNNTINEMELNLSNLRENTEKVEQKLALTEREKDKLAHELVEMTQSLNQMSQHLQVQREKSFLYERERENQCFNSISNVLGREDEEINREIHDLKEKYEYEIIQLQMKVRDYHIEREELQLRILELEHTRPYRPLAGQDASTQTQVNVIKACFFNSLEDDLDGQCSPHQPGNNFQPHDEDHLSDFQLNLNINSTNNHAINTPRDVDHYSDKDHDEDNYYEKYNDASFQEEKSTSNAPSRYMETMEQLTAELAEAYQKINELTTQLNALEDENRRLRSKNGQEKSENGKSIGGYLTNFFKK